VTAVLTAPSGSVLPGSAAVGDPMTEARAWLARELHDGAVQRLTYMTVELEGLKRSTGLEVELGRLQQTARGALSDLRRLLSELRDEPADDAGFVASIRDMLTDLFAGTPIEPTLVVRSWPCQLPRHQAGQLRCIVGEALSNVRRHSAATRVTVTLQSIGGRLAITIADNGRGMVCGEGGFGLRGMRERALLLGGRLSIESAPQRQTIVRCTVPLGRA